MPLYKFECEQCGNKVEVIQGIEGEAPLCCGIAMTKRPTFPSMIKWKGEGGFPSLRKTREGTAPYTSGYGEYGD